MIESRRNLGEVGPRGTYQHIRIPLPSPVPDVEVESVFYTLADKKTSKAVVLKASNSDAFDLAIHPLFAEKGIVFEGNRLINQEKTKELWDETVGTDPKETVAGDTAAFAFAPNHYGWMTGQILIENGKPVLIKNDQGTLTEDLTALSLQKGKWKTQEVSVVEGVVQDPESIEDTQIGFSLPLLVKDGETVPLEESIHDPRYLGDLRNVFDFANGEKMDSDFWLYIRPLLPENAEDAKKLLKGESVVTISNKLTKEETERLATLIEENEKVSKLLKIASWNDDESELQTQLTINGKLPYNRIPLIGSGYDADGNFVAMIIGGRGVSPNATLPEAAEMMQDFMETGGFGPAGGDVSLVDNKGVVYNAVNTRPHPVALTIIGQSA